MKKIILLIAIGFIGCKSGSDSVEIKIQKVKTLLKKEEVPEDKFYYYYTKWANNVDSSQYHTEMFIKCYNKKDLKGMIFHHKECKRFNDSAKKYLKLEEQSMRK